MTYRSALLLLASALPAFAAVKVTVSRTDTEARPAQTISIPFAEVKKQLPNLRLDHVLVRDAAGAQVAAQVTNFNPDLRPAQYDEILIQVGFAAGQQSTTFTVDDSTDPVAPAPARVFARHVPERLDDFAFENDRIAHRIYGPSLTNPALAKGSTLVSSGIDVWAKRVNYLIIDRWYTKGHDAYHVDSGEGIDLYGVNNARGCGGSGIWSGDRLYVSTNWKSHRVIANGPLRAIFELSYDTWDANGVYVTETKRFTVDAGTNFHRVESTYTINGKVKEITPAYGVTKHPASTTESMLTAAPDNSWISLWEAYKKDGSMGTAVILAPGTPRKGLAGTQADHLILSEATADKPVVYYIGAGWDRSGQFADRAAWEAEVKAFAARLASPLSVTVSN